MCDWINDLSIAMNNNEAAFFKELGHRIAKLRKEQHLTQTQLAEMLGVKQYVIASYESARRRIPVSLLPPLAQAFGVSLEELLDVKNENVKPGPTPRLQQQIQQLSRLPKAKQRFVSDFLKTVLQQAA